MLFSAVDREFTINFERPEALMGVEGIASVIASGGDLNCPCALLCVDTTRVEWTSTDPGESKASSTRLCMRKLASRVPVSGLISIDAVMEGKVTR